MNLGIIGCGVIGSKRAFSCSGSKVIALADTNLELAKSLSSKIPESWYTNDWKKIISDKRIDAVIISTSHNFLAQITLEAIKSKKHVLVEKPGARNASEFKPIINAAKKNNVVVKIGYNHRYHPSFIKTKKLIDDGLFGPILFIRGRYGHGGRIGYQNEWRCVKSVSGGGELIDQGSHLIDLSTWFLGPLDVAYSYTPTFFWDSGVDDNCFLVLKNNYGNVAWLHASWTEWKNLFSFEIFFKNAKIQIDGLGGSYGTERITIYKMLPEMGPPETTIYEFPFQDRSWECEFIDFSTAVECGNTFFSNLCDSYQVLSIIDSIYKGASHDNCS